MPRTMNRMPRVVAVIAALLLALAKTEAEQEPYQGWSKAAFTTAPFAPGISHRQDICEYFNAYGNGTVELRDALRGLALRPVFGTTEYFPYDADKGIDPRNPGIVVAIMDELAQRAGFTWRDSFGVIYWPPTGNSTYTENLLWGVESYDIAADWWDRTVERMDLGITFLEPWLDGSVILIDKEDLSQTETSSSIVYWNWIRPFDSTVWLLILFTTIFSALVYQLIEFLQGDRDDRSLWQWTRDNFYLGALNFSGNFAYEPTSLGGMIFGVSMTLFALLITATYTANLASLLVISKQQPAAIESIEQAVSQKLPICTWAGTASDEYIRAKHSRAKLFPKQDELSAFQALQEGECELFAAQKDNWLTLAGDNRYNPDCDMEWVGRTVRSVSSGFAVKADAGWKCTTFIKDVLNLHMVEMMSEGVLEQMKARQRWLAQQVHPADCGAGADYYDGNVRRNRRLKAMAMDNRKSEPLESTVRSERKRMLKAGASAVPSNNDGENDAYSLTLEHMIGTFVLHWALMAMAVFVTFCNTYKRGWGKEPSVEEAAPPECSPHESVKIYAASKSSKEAALPESSPPESSKICAASDSSKESNTQAVSTSNAVFDVEGKYGQLSAQDKALVDTMIDMMYQRSHVPDLFPPPEPVEEEAEKFADESEKVVTFSSLYAGQT